MMHTHRNARPKFFSLQEQKKVGMAPGTLLYTGEQKMENVHMTLLEYDKDAFAERDIADIAQVKYSRRTARLNIDRTCHEHWVVHFLSKKEMAVTRTDQ